MENRETNKVDRGAPQAGPGAVGRFVASLALVVFAGACASGGSASGATQPQHAPAAQAMQSQAPASAGEKIADNQGSHAMQSRQDQAVEPESDNQGSYAMQSRQGSSF